MTTLKTCRVLVTGAGSGVGQGIVKALRISELPITIIGADIDLMNAALYRTDEAILIPKVELEGSLDALIRQINANNIDIIMIGSEFELSFFAKNKKEIESSTKAKIIVAPLKTIEIADDKWLTIEFLKNNNLPYPETALALNLKDALKIAANLGYPLILKARRGTSSRNVYLVNNKEDLERFYPITPSPILQGIIKLPSSKLGYEYTCSVFKRSDGKLIGPFTARRTVRSGTSWHIEVATFLELNDVLIKISKNLDYTGSLNIKLMLTENGATTFELNARFSGTTAVRAKFGFNEPEMVLKDIFYGQKVTEPNIRKGIAIRYNEEVFLENVNLEDLSIFDKGIVKPWF